MILPVFSKEPSCVVKMEVNEAVIPLLFLLSQKN